MIFPPAEDRGPAADPARFLSTLFEAMVAAADPVRLLPGHLPQPPRGRTVVIAAGKAAAAMARTVEEHWRGELSGLAVTRYGHGVPCNSIDVIEAGHPLPDCAGANAAERVLALVKDLSSDDLVLVLLSGGGSALLSLPAPCLDLEDLRQVNVELLKSGAPIGEVNCVRKHLSAITGGRLAAAAWPAEVVTFAISDVPGDDPAVIASGPTVGDPSTFAQAVEIVKRYDLQVPESVRRHLEDARDETPKPGDPRLTRSRLTLLATPATALDAAASAAREAGVEPMVLGAEIQGEARIVAAEHAAMVRCRQHCQTGMERPIERRPLLILSGGETTVTVRGGGRGGRNTEYLLAFALALQAEDDRDTGGSAQAGDHPDAQTAARVGGAADARRGRGRAPSVYALAADTDGIDGTAENAGAFLYPNTLARARAAGLDPNRSLAANDSYGFFAALGDLFVTGATRTNVNDFRAILVL
jgi:glycerate 2-kinase